MARVRRSGEGAVDLVLYVSPHSRYALTAQHNCRALLARFRAGDVHFEVCDITEYPERAEADAVCYTPMLVKRRPLPRTYVVGDLSNPDPVIELLESCGVAVAR